MAAIGPVPKENGIAHPFEGRGLDLLHVPESFEGKILAQPRDGLASETFREVVEGEKRVDAPYRLVVPRFRRRGRFLVEPVPDALYLRQNLLKRLVGLGLRENLALLLLEVLLWRALGFMGPFGPYIARHFHAFLAKSPRNRPS